MTEKSELAKSRFLAGVVGWREVTDKDEWPKGVAMADLEAESWWDIDRVWYRYLPNLYEKENMFLAWKVHLWALKDLRTRVGYTAWWEGEIDPDDIGWKPWALEDVQELMLDKVIDIIDGIYIVWHERAS